MDTVRPPGPAAAPGAASATPRSRLRPGPPRVLDALLAAGLFFFSLLVAVSLDTGLAGLLGVPVAAALCAPLAWRRTRPVAAAGAVFAAAGVQVVLPGQTPSPADLAVLVAVYSLTAHGPDATRRIGLYVGLLGAVLATLRWYAADALTDSATYTEIDGSVVEIQESLASRVVGVAFLTAFLALTVLVAWGFGLLRRARLARVEALVERARFVEVEREQQIRLAAQNERTRIARELHDVVAHSLAVMITQADGGRYAAANRPEAATEALETIADTGRRALTEMRRLLGVLRDDVPGADAATAPQPGLGDLDGMLEGLRSGGLAVTLQAQGEPQPLPPGLDLAAYRIVQEGLTNVLKHAGPGATARVYLWWAPSALTVDVVDDGRGAAAPTRDGQGHGLLGMRERATVFGGTVQAGPMPGGGWGVRAVLPLSAVAPAVAR